MMRCYCLGGPSGKVDSWKAGTSVGCALLRLKTRTFNISLLGLDKSSGYWPTGTQEAKASWGKWKLTSCVRGNRTSYERKVKCHCFPSDCCIDRLFITAKHMGSFDDPFTPLGSLGNSISICEDWKDQLSFTTQTGWTTWFYLKANKHN